MESLQLKYTAAEAAKNDDASTFGKAPQPWRLRNNWVKPKRKRKKVEIDLWKGLEED